jgi:hypothetical protein
MQRNQSQNNNMATPDADQVQGRCQNMSNIEIPATGATTGSYPVRNSASALAVSPLNGDAQLSQATKDLSSISLVTLDLAKPMSVINTDNETATRVTDSVERWMFVMERDKKIELIAVLQCCIHCIYRC